METRFSASIANVDICPLSEQLGKTLPGVDSVNIYTVWKKYRGAIKLVLVDISKMSNQFTIPGNVNDLLWISLVPTSILFYCGEINKQVCHEAQLRKGKYRHLRPNQWLGRPLPPKAVDNTDPPVGSFHCWCPQYECIAPVEGICRAS